MKYGKFDDLNKEYLIEDAATPLPWINYLGNKDFFGLISNTCGGYNFYRDAKLRRITRYRYNNIPHDSSGRFYYIKDKDTIWNPGFLPTKTPLDSYLCRHGLGYSIFEAAKDDVSTSLTCFVPLNDNLEINKLTVRNNSNIEKNLQIYSSIEWCLYNAVDDATNFQRNLNIGEVEVEESTIYHKTEYRERRNHYAFYSVNSKIDGFDTRRDTFLGKFNDWSTPIAVTSSTSFNSIASGSSPMASHRLDIKLLPGEERTFVFLIGYIENLEEEKWFKTNVINKAKAYHLIKKYSNLDMVTKSFGELKNYWEHLLEKFNLKTDDDKLNRMVNIWNQYQCMVTFNMSRSASYFESGIGRGMGFRDSCQDILGFVHLIPERSRERIIDIASIQFEDGSTYHQYQPLTKRGNDDIGSGFNDDPLWLIACTVAYIKETGDLSILESLVPFNNQEDNKSSLLEHLKRSIDYTINNLGPHGLPLIGRADWNDTLNLNCFSKNPGESFQTTSNYDSRIAESIFIAGMFVKYAKEYSDLCKYLGSIDEAVRVDQEIWKMEQAVLKHGWDGKWFLRAYDAYSNKVGSHINEEGKIFIEPQGFCVMAGIGEKEGLAQIALDSVDKYLVNDYGVELLNPTYTKYYLNLGEISSYPPGYKENGSVFCHNNPWIVLAHTRLGNNNRAFEIYKKNSPAYLEDLSEIHRTEPYVYSQTIAGRASPNYGEAKNSWLTGTASWCFVAISQGILGIIPEFDGLKIKPRLPDDITSYEILRIFRGARYNIKVKNNKTNNYSIYVDGILIESDIIPYEEGKTEYLIELV